jgi:hypothetical protein
VKSNKSMRYKEVASKTFYALGAISILIFLIFLTFILYKSLHSDQLTPFILVIALICIAVGMIYVYFKKIIYGKIDTEKQVFVFGNLLMENEVPVKEIEFYGPMSIYTSLIKIKITGHTYYYISTLADCNNYFKLMDIQGKKSSNHSTGPYTKIQLALDKMFKPLYESIEKDFGPFKKRFWVGGVKANQANYAFIKNVT